MAKLRICAVVLVVTSSVAHADIDPDVGGWVSVDGPEPTERLDIPTPMEITAGERRERPDNPGMGGGGGQGGSGGGGPVEGPAFSANAGTRLHPQAAAQLHVVGRAFLQRTGRTLHVTRGTDTARNQAELLVNELVDDSANGRALLSKYKASEAKRAIVAAFRANPSLEDARQAIERVLVARPSFSKHLDPASPVADIRTRDLTDEQVLALIDAVRASGGQVLVEVPESEVLRWRRIVRGQYREGVAVGKATHRHLHVTFEATTPEVLRTGGEEMQLAALDGGAVSVDAYGQVYVWRHSDEGWTVNVVEGTTRFDVPFNAIAPLPGRHPIAETSAQQLGLLAHPESSGAIYLESAEVGVFALPDPTESDLVLRQTIDEFGVARWESAHRLVALDVPATADQDILRSIIQTSGGRSF